MTVTVLVPHRDARLPLRAWSAALFAAGMEGAWSFPWVVPLALVKRPLAAEELKRLACLARQQINQVGGKLTAGGPVTTAFGEEAFVYGPALDADFSPAFFEAFETADTVITRFFPRAVLGAALAHGLKSDGLKPDEPLPSGLPPPPPVSFRAAALANMSWRPLPADGCGLFCEWEIGPLHWLPKH